jgi:hypothetical protein
VHPADHVTADGDVSFRRGSASEVGVEADESLEPVPGDSSPPGEIFEVVLLEVAVLVLQVQQFAEQLQCGTPATASSAAAVASGMVIPIESQFQAA